MRTGAMMRTANNHYVFVFSVLSVTLWLTSFSSAAAPLQSLAVYPPDVQLTTRRAKQAFVVQATFADGITRDVTTEAQVSFSNPALVKHSGNLLTPAADGGGQMT